MWESKSRLIPRIAAIIAAAGVSTGDSLAQGYPVKPVRMVLGFSAGGLSDVLG